MEYAIAEPHDDFVELIEYIDRQLSKPITVGEMFARKVHTLKSTDSLGRGLELIRERRFNQIPIYRNREFIGLVTAAGITFWLADQYTKGFDFNEMPTLLDVITMRKRNLPNAS